MSVQKSTKQLDWDGLRYFRAVAEHGTLTAAARVLAVRHTTVARRIDTLEAELAAHLFLRNPRGYTLTRVGTSLLESVRAMQASVDDVSRLAHGEDVHMAGSVRIATADALAKHVVLAPIAELLRENPELTIELLSDTRQHDLSRREADIALRLGASEDTRLVGRRLLSVGFGLYAARGHKKTDPKRARYVAFDESVEPMPHARWLAEHAPDAVVALRANRQETLIEAVRQGIGLGLLPCFMAERDRTLVKLLGPDRVFSRELWLLVHSDLQGSRRVRAVIDAVSARVLRERARLAG